MTRCAQHTTPPDGVLPCGCTTDVVERLFDRAGIALDPGRGLWSTISAHVTPHLGPLEGVLHTGAALDDPSVGCVSEFLLHAPSANRQSVDIATVGMSRKRMRLPSTLRRRGAPPRAELILRLPPKWLTSATVTETLMRDAPWLMLALRILAQVPHETRSYLGDEQGLDVRARAVPLGMLPEIPFDAALVADPGRFGTQIPVLPRAHRDLPAGRGSVRFLTIVPIAQREFEYALDRGADRLFDALAAAGVDDRVQLGREPVV